MNGESEATGARGEGFVEQIERHRGLLFKVANAYCQRPDERVDLVQDIIVEAWQAFPRFDGRVQFSTWLYRIAVNVAISAHRGTQRRVHDALSLDALSIDLAAVDRALADDPDLHALHQLIHRLEPLDRALVLLYLEGCSHDESAVALGLSVTNVATRLSRIKRRLSRAHTEAENA